MYEYFGHFFYRYRGTLQSPYRDGSLKHIGASQSSCREGAFQTLQEALLGLCKDPVEKVLHKAPIEKGFSKASGFQEAFIEKELCKAPVENGFVCTYIHTYVHFSPLSYRY